MAQSSQRFEPPQNTGRFRVPYKEGKLKSRLSQPKGMDEQLKDDIWCFLYRMGYRTISLGGMSISYESPDREAARKTISVLAEDDETVVVVECKTREDRGRKALAKEIAASQLARRALQKQLQTRHQADRKHKILWLYATRNIIWAEKDVEDAGAAGIKIITENEYQYFDSFIRYMGPAGRFQFLAEYFEGQDIPGLENVRIPATQGVFGKNKFYSFVTTPRRLLKIAFINHQALNHPDGRPAYQRMIAPARIKEIEHFIVHRGGYFPTNILVNFNKVCRFDLLPKDNADPVTKFGWLYLPKAYKSAWIIDGQHRLYGYSHLSGKYLDQPIAVIAFELLPVRDEAELFVTINHEQKSVPKSVLVGLQADLKINSSVPKERLGALASSVAKALGSDTTGPFFQRFSVQGMHSLDNQSLTIPEVVNGITRAGLLGRVVQNNHVPGPFTGITDEQTIRRAHKTINQYFHLIRDANPKRWDQGREGFVATNPGVRGFLMLFAECCTHLQMSGAVDPANVSEDTLVQAVSDFVGPALTFFQDDDETEIRARFSRKYGEGGAREYFENLAEIVCVVHQDFGSESLRTTLALKKDQRRSLADAEIIELSKDMLDTVVATLKKAYGEKVGPTGEKAFWRLGVESRKIKASAYAKQLENKSEQPIEAFLDIVDLKEIVKQRSNWPHFEHIFNIQMPDEKGGKHLYLDWIDKFNELRRIPAHPSGGRTYSEDDYETLKYIKNIYYRNKDSLPLTPSS
ncbi:MAG: DGQHR domain-containing protein, partial [Pseudomonadota bacterium]